MTEQYFYSGTFDADLKLLSLKDQKGEDVTSLFDPEAGTPFLAQGVLAPHVLDLSVRVAARTCCRSTPGGLK